MHSGLPHARSLIPLTLMLAATVIAGCGGQVSTVPGEPQVLQPAQEGDYDPVAKLPCGTFSLAALDEPAGAESMQGAEFDGLRRAVALSREGYQHETWRLVRRDQSSAMFVASLENAWACIVVASRHDGWGPLDEGEASQLNVALADGLGPAQWKPVAGPASRDVTELPVLLQEQECAGGSYATGRIVAPLVNTSADSLTITFGVRPLVSELSVTCPANPWTPAILVLPEPLGERKLLDGGLFPPAVRTEQKP
jgi:hypothetical protein